VIKDYVPVIEKDVLLRQELLIPHASAADSLSPWLRELLDAQRRVQAKLYVASVCPVSALGQVMTQTQCGVGHDLGVFIVQGRRLQRNDDYCHLTEDWQQHYWTDAHDGDRWLAVCSDTAAQHMVHQGFVLAAAASPSDAPDAPPPPVSVVRPTTYLVKLASGLTGHDLVGLSVRCPVPGQQLDTVPIVIAQVGSRRRVCVCVCGRARAV
jgi:hypothetical protein